MGKTVVMTGQVYDIKGAANYLFMIREKDGFYSAVMYSCIIRHLSMEGGGWKTLHEAIDWIMERRDE